MVPLLPVQGAAGLPATPARALAVAVLERAVLDLRCARRLGTEAWRWVLDETVSPWPYTFENLCAALGLDAGRIRRTLGGVLAREEESRCPTT